MTQRAFVPLPVFAPRRTRPHMAAGRRRSVLLVWAALGAAGGGGCSRGRAEEAGAAPPGGRSTPSTEPLTQGEYTVRSGARFTGATLRLVDNKMGAYSTQLVLPNGRGLYSGLARPAGADSIEMSLSCQCPVGNDGPGGSTRYDVVSYDGRYRVREIGGGRLELRQTDGTAVDTVARAQ